MDDRWSFYGPCLKNKLRVAYDTGRRGVPRRKPILMAVTVTAILIVATVLAFASENGNDLTARTSSQTILTVPLIEQRKDTTMVCNGGGTMFCQPVPGSWPYHPLPPLANPSNSTDIFWLDLQYGTMDDCPHCSAYCAPASIAMISTFRRGGNVSNFTAQDGIYDAGKFVNENASGDDVIDTHAVGMYDGTSGQPPEVQTAFIWSIGPCVQHDWVSGIPLTAAQLQTYINLGYPVLWLDHFGWPKNCTYPQDPYRSDQGHAKVIIGYDDSNTADTSDDLALINDPWPEYNQRSIVPIGALPGPGGTYDPYWLPLPIVNLADPADIFLVDTYPPIPEFSTILVPISITLMAVVLFARRNRRTEHNLRDR